MSSKPSSRSRSRNSGVLPSTPTAASRRIVDAAPRMCSSCQAAGRDGGSAYGQVDRVMSGAMRDEEELVRIREAEKGCVDGSGAVRVDGRHRAKLRLRQDAPDRIDDLVQRISWIDS